VKVLPQSRSTRRECSVTRFAHRACFWLISGLPKCMASKVLTSFFNLRFLRGNPWPYESCPYEAAKRVALLDEIPVGAHTIVEVGSADGHNLLAVASHSQESIIIGIDISHRACSIARAKTRNQTKIHVENTDLTELLRRHPWLRGSVDHVIVSEVLYYMGGDKSMSTQLRFLSTLLAQDGKVILVHGSEDADRLHMRVGEILNLARISESRKTALGKNFLVTTLGHSTLRRDLAESVA